MALEDYIPALKYGQKVSGANIDTDTIEAGDIAPLAVDTSELAASAVTTAKIADGAVTPVKSAQLEAVTATADGLTTGLISVTARHVTITSANASHIATLPASVVGKEITGFVGSNGCLIQTTAASNITINGVDSDGTSSFTLAANTYFVARCVSATAWLVYTQNTAGAFPTANIADGAITAAKVRGTEARTATADGTTTGAITAPTSLITVVTVTSANATDQIALPAITSAGIGNVIYLSVAANGYELITPASSNNTINLVDGDGTNQLDVAANTTVRCTQVSATAWLAETIAATTIAVTAPDND
jgi:trimeric autotransporter adhesin